MVSLFEKNAKSEIAGGNKIKLKPEMTSMSPDLEEMLEYIPEDEKSGILIYGVGDKRDLYGRVNLSDCYTFGNVIRVGTDNEEFQLSCQASGSHFYTMVSSNKAKLYCVAESKIKKENL